MDEIVMAIISRQKNEQVKEYLLVSSTKDFDEQTGFYYPPGGHKKEGETEENCIVRELKEELGLDIVATKKFATTPTDMPNQTAHWWQCELTNPKQDFFIKTDEIADARWFTTDELLERTDLWPATAKFFDEYILNESS